MPRLYAQNTEVPISRSRGQIDTLLRDWGADGIQWQDLFTKGRSTLRFIWHHEDKPYVARIDLQLPEEIKLREAATNRYGKIAQGKYQKLLDGRGKREHRVLLLWLRAALNAVEEGIVSAETLFLPFFEDARGQTVAEIAIPQLANLTNGSKFLLEAGK